MNSRLQQFLDLENLTPARFADMMGLQRSGISHLLSGRNKPGYEFIKKFLKTFPHVNAEWFLLGAGKPFKFQQAEGASAETTTPLSDQHSGSFPHSASSSLPGVPTDELRSPVTSDFSAETSLFAWDEGGIRATNENPANFSGPLPGKTHSSQGNQDITQQPEAVSNQKTATERIVRPIPQKKIGRITVFYTDGSFDEFFPR